MNEPVKEPDREAVEVRQGTGPDNTISVLTISLLLAAIAGAVLVTWWWLV
jgi:hypothetical protein